MKRQRARVEWPVLRTYDAAHVSKIALPLGGIGTGTVSLGGRGDLRDWEIMNTPHKGFVPGSDGRPSAVLWCRVGRQAAITRLLEGPIENHLYEGAMGCSVPHHGLPRFAHVEFAAAYPLGQVRLRDPDVPLRVTLRAFNPLVPGDVDASSWPLAALTYRLENRTRHTVQAAVCLSLPNFIGVTPHASQPQGNQNRYRAGPRVRGLFLESQGVARHHSGWGTIALTTSAGPGISYRSGWADLSWGGWLLDFWDDFSADGELTNHPTQRPLPMASLAVKRTIPAGGWREIPFLLTWHFPNRLAWHEKDPASGPGGVGDGGATRHPAWVGNHYTTRFRDAWDVARQAWAAWPELERRTVAFVRAFCASDAPLPIREAALFNLSTLRSQTCFRTADGRFYGWEGCRDKEGCCHGSCTHVWNYEQGLGFLFGELARSMSEVAFGHGTDERGRMRFRVDLPLDRPPQFTAAAADGQMGAIMRFYRDWQLSGDDTFLRVHWPKVRRALEFCWIPHGWDADQDGVMEGCQHNTMDVEYYGPNPQMGTWYLGALRAVEEMARYLGETEWAGKCRRLFENGRRWCDEQLFNGEYYEHHLRPPPQPDQIPPELLAGMGATNRAAPELQLGAGCLVDQLVGQWFAHVCGLGYLLRPDHVRQTLRSIRRYNWRNNFRAHFNHLRSFVLGEEAGLLMASYPRGQRPRRPFPYCNEVMTGFEYTAATHMLREGLTSAALECLAAIRDRYDGKKRNPFDEAECGHHYARALASWAGYLFWTGFEYSAVTGVMEFATATKPATWFWSTGSAWGTFRQTRRRVTLTVKAGELRLAKLQLRNRGEFTGRARPLRAGQSCQWTP